jgi:hypothetical protein
VPLRAVRWIWAASVLLMFVTSHARAQEKVRTCVVVEASTPERDALVRLVESEVDRHPSHRAVKDPKERCSTTLRVELIEIGGDRFLTGRVGGEVPQRAQIAGKGGKALETALAELLRVVLGNDPVTLKAPGGHSWLGDRVLELRDHARSRFDFAALESLNLVSDKAAFSPGLLFAFSREIVDVRVGVEAMVFENLDAHPGRLGLDTQIRLHGVVTYYLSSEADVAGFIGASIGLDHQRFSGPRAPEIGRGEGT